MFDKDLLVFARTDDATGEVVVVAVNRATEPFDATFDAPDAWEDAAIRDIWNDLAVDAAEGKVTITVPGQGASILAAEAPGAGS